MPATPTPHPHRTRERAMWTVRARRVELVGSGLVLALAVVVVVGWLAGIAAMVQVQQDTQSMKLNAAVAFGLLAGAHLTGNVNVRRGLQAGALVLAMVMVLQYAFDLSLGIDELVVTDDVEPAAPYPGRPSESTVISVALLGAAGLLSSLGRRKIAEYLFLVPLTFGMVAVWGYAYGVSSMYRVGPYSSMAFHTAVAIVVLSLLGLLAVRHGTLQWIAYGRDSGAVLQRILIPLAVVLLPFLGWLVVRGQDLEYFDLAFAAALLVSFMALLTIAVGLIAGITAMRTDRERDQLVDELHHVNQELEDRVRARSLQVNRQRTKLALLEERDRIARDLHDRVIQRIFAAGLQVGSMSRTARKLVGPDGAPDPRLPEGLNSVATELDMAIRELRNSIFELTSIADHDDIEQVVRDVVARASRILGFMPKISVSGEVAGLDADLVANIASVLQEALSNVARHAQASEAEVVFAADEHEVEVRVSDDGIGMPDPLPRSSGVSNLLNRARTLGGSATWAPGAEGGTVMTWRVPRDPQEGAAVAWVVDDVDVQPAEFVDGVSQG